MLMHNGMLADPDYEWSVLMKEITDKKNKKTKEDSKQLARFEWRGGIYLDADEKQVIVPDEMAMGVVVSGATKFNKGPVAKAGVVCKQMWFPLKYDGPKDLKKLAADKRHTDRRLVVIPGSGKRVIRTRPRFDEWSVDVEYWYEDRLLNEKDLDTWLDTCGYQVGMGDYTPRFGRFDMEVLS